MIDISNNPRVTQLLGRIEEARKTLARLEEGTPGRARFEREMLGWYEEVGRYVHWLMRQDALALARIEAEARRWAAEYDERIARGERGILSHGHAGPEDDWTADVSFPDPPSVEDASIIELASDSAEAAIDRRELHDSQDVSMSLTMTQPEPTGDGDAAVGVSDMFDVVVLHTGDVEIVPSGSENDITDPSIERVDDADIDSDAHGTDVSVRMPGITIRGPGDEDGGVTDSVAVSAYTPEEHAWVTALRDLLEVVGAPESGALPEADCLAAANRLLNATTNMNVRWMGFPENIQRSLLGYLACRARNLQMRMAVDVEVRLTLGRLRRFRDARNLPRISALEEEGRPEKRTWELDAHLWWNKLREGM